MKEENSVALFISLQADAFRGRAPSRFVAALLQGLGCLAIPQESPPYTPFKGDSYYCNISSIKERVIYTFCNFGQFPDMEQNSGENRTAPVSASLR